MKKIGFIGTGVMGASIVKHLLSAGYEVHVYNRTKSKTDELVELGAIWKDTPRDIAQASELIFTMVGFPEDVEEVYYSENGIFNGVQSGSILIDLTTSQPSLAEKIYETAKEKGTFSLDAPVSGGDLGARNGTLTTMVGGDEEAFETMKPIFMTFSGTLELQGPAGSGQHTKMANQIMIAGTMTGLTELLVYAKAAGLNLEKVLKTVGGGSAANWSLQNYGPRILKEDYSAGFFVKHFIKDLGIALNEAEKLGVNLPSTLNAKKLYDQLEDAGNGDDGTQALIKLWWEK
ncbi:NAD(P)-dependent oxidoreductase [Marinilactibacillus psychrotolerans]|uniref:3-hydroxyisobutyrate dehydrogenase n=1 Tax=Marinilactibacillus psychrotolerans TaxID=191770 RepID=A0AAV3WN11_9LACT|nr:NAD(P)-dependent oxidoreductase [Marinilactibacillus psychrotolerans]GEL66055.1 2-hydroxy-3-oxopropionate reductase [Marinilactibacillus psychrotolerans]GEQ34564.1 3-hydroxyisobutyrate dehydrogenase [Marinilactibacillus psychrotolerans]SDB99662.1 3-hydroxyisobutyrate dehydrogenase [Marinilactibacillus psychrotolerans]